MTPQLTPERLLETRARLLRMHFEAGVGHIGGNLSSLDIMMSLYHDVLGPEDAFVLSKGHSAGALYATLWSKGILTEADLQTFHKDGTRLSAHPPVSGVETVLFATGSLGHGPGLASGLALAKKFQSKPGRVFCLTSDGEWNEGSNWEALIFARHHNLNNLTLIVDLNGLQGFGTTKEVADMGSLSAKFAEFGWRVVETDGHDIEALRTTLLAPTPEPTVIVASTRKGFGVSYMEHRMEWHYLPMDAALFEQAMNDLQALGAPTEEDAE